MTALLYRSRARPGLRAADLNAIIATATAHNPTVGVTGVLLYGTLAMVPGAPGEFVQWMEGPEHALDALYASIAEDPRHFDLEMWARGPVSDLVVRSGCRLVEGRLFPTWSMRLIGLAELPATLPGFLDAARTWTRHSPPPHP